MKHFHYHIKRIFQHELINGSVFMFIGSMVLNVCAFVFNLLYARKLTTSDYGTYTALIALFTIATIPAQPFATTLVAFASEFFVEKDIERESYLYKKSLIILLAIAAASIVVAILGAPLLMNFFHIAQPVLLFLTGCMIASLYLGIIQSAFLQARLQFFLNSLLIATGGISKIFFGIIFLSLGFQVFGALGAVILSIIAPFLLGFVPLWKLLIVPVKETRVDFRKIFLYALPTSIAIICLTLLTSTDLLLVKHFYSAQKAGLYAGISLIGKSIFYFTGTIPMVMFPLLIKRYKNGENVYRLLSVSLFLVIAPALFITFLFVIFPHIIISLFLGKASYQQIAPYLGVYGLFITIFSGINVISLFFLSLKKLSITVFLALGSLSQIVLLFLFHHSYYQIISISLGVSIALLLVLFFYLLSITIYKAS